MDITNITMSPPLFLDLMQSFLYDLKTCFLIQEERSAKYLA